MDDTVSRQAVLNVLDEIEAQYVFDDGHDRLLQYAKNKVAALPCEYPTPLETIHCTNEQIERLRNTILNALHEPTVVRCGKCKYLTDTVSEFDPELHLCAFGLWMEQTDFCSRGDNCKHHHHSIYCGMGSEFVTACEAICEAPEVDIPHWIPCSERMPEEYGNYLITTYDGDVDIGTIDPNRKNVWSACNADGFYWLRNVIAWAPLPEPYKERSEK